MITCIPLRPRTGGRLLWSLLLGISMTSASSREALAKPKRGDLPAFNNNNISADQTGISNANTAVTNDNTKIRNDNVGINVDNAAINRLNNFLNQTKGLNDPTLTQDIQNDINKEKAAISTLRTDRTKATQDAATQNGIIKKDKKDISAIEAAPPLVDQTALQNYQNTVTQARSNAQTALNNARSGLSAAEKKLTADQRAVAADNGQINQLNGLLKQLNASDDPQIRKDILAQIATLNTAKTNSIADEGTQNGTIKTDRAAVRTDSANLSQDKAAAAALGNLVNLQNEIAAAQAKSANLSKDQGAVTTQGNIVAADIVGLYNATLILDTTTKGTQQYAVALANFKAAQTALANDQIKLDAANKTVSDDRKAAKLVADDTRKLFAAQQKADDLASPIVDAANTVIGVASGPVGDSPATGGGDGSVNLAGATGVVAISGPTGINQRPN